MSFNDNREAFVSKQTIYFVLKHVLFRFLDLPREIRDLVYRHCFVRPVGLSPGPIYEKGKNYHRKRGGVNRGGKITKYRCYWNGRRRFLSIDQYDEMTPVDGQMERMLVTWTSIPTREQHNILLNVARKLPDTQVDTTTGVYSKIEHRMNRRHDGTIEVINSQWQVISGLTGIGLLRTSQQVYNEACGILYGENTFVIDTAFVHRPSTFDLSSYLSSGYSDNNGQVTSMNGNYRRVQKLLERGRYSDFARNDPLLMFLRKIGPHCASLLRSLKINGQFKTQPTRLRMTASVHVSTNAFDRNLPFANIIPVYTHILHDICANLISLTLDQTMGGDIGLSARWLWVEEDDRSDGERIAEAVEVIVKGLPTLTRLQLGDYSTPWEDGVQEPSGEDGGDSSGISTEIESNDPWGVAARWSAFVADRYNERAFGKGVKTAADGKIDCHITQDRAFTKLPVIHQAEPGPAISGINQAPNQQPNDDWDFKQIISRKQPRNMPPTNKHTSAQQSSDHEKLHLHRRDRGAREPVQLKTVSKTHNSFALLMDEDDWEEFGD